MSIEKHPTKQGFFYVKSYPNGRKGKPSRDLVEGYANAQALDASIKERKQSLSPASSVHPRMSDIVDEYLRWAKVNLRKVTYINKERRLERYIIPALGHLRVKELQQRDLDAYAATRNAWTYDTDYRIFMAMITWMIKRRYADRLTWIPEKKSVKAKVKTVPHPADIMQAIESIPKEQHRVMFSLMLFTGLRWNETRLLRWENVDINTGTIIVDEAKTTPDVIIIPEPIREWFEAHRIDSGYVFESLRKGKPYVRLQNVLMRAGVVAGIHLTSHVFRHASATYLYEATNDIYQVQAHLRHTRVTTTEIYARMSVSRRNKAVGTILDYVANNQNTR